MKCDKCVFDYPKALLQPMFIGGAVPENAKWYTKPICAICALEISNLIHEVKHDHFTGTNAEKMRQDAIKWRKNRR